MLTWLTRKSKHSRTAVEIYGSIVTSARQSCFYDPWGVPDTREGRLEMIMLHLVLVMRRLGRIGPAGQDLGRRIAETFITDMDDSMREIGIGDLTVPRKIKKTGAALYDRHRDYAAALDAAAPTEALAALAAALKTAIAGDTAVAGLDLARLSSYTLHLARDLDAVADSDCLAGRMPPLTAGSGDTGDRR